MVMDLTRRNFILATLLGLALLPLAASGSFLAAADADLDNAQMTPEEQAMQAGFAALPDPAAWSQDAASGTHFRRATAHELSVNAWRPGTFLVETGSLADLRTGPAQATFLVPLGDSSAQTLTLPHVGDRSDEAYYTTGAGLPGAAMPADTATAPTFHYYALRDAAAPDVEARITADDEGGYFGQANLHGVRATLETNEAWWALDAVPGVGAPAAGRVSIVTLTPATSAVVFPPFMSETLPLDLTAQPRTVHNYNFNDMGEMKWCTRYISDWKAKIDTIKSETINGFNTNAGGTDAHLARVHDHCWTASTLADATNCANSGGCVDANGHSYPYNADGSTATEYRLDVWDDVAHSHLHYTFATASVSQAIHDGTQSDPSGALCGLSKFPDTSAPTAANGGSVAAGLPMPSGCKDYVSTHEMGHNFYATHDNTAYGTCGGGGSGISVMGQSGYAGASCRFDDFRSSAKTEITNCVPNSTCPRTGTA
jgi:hypothetical protein